MKTNNVLRIVGTIVLIILVLPVDKAGAFANRNALPPVDMFQLPWEQGLSWVSLDGFDYGFKRKLGSPHNYMNGGAVDFAPRKDMIVGEDTSSFWVTAAAAGTVIELSPCHMKIDHGNGWTTEYQFLANIQVELGEAVYRNQRLAVIADGLGQKFCPPALDPDIPHLHFSLRPNMVGATFAGWQFKYIPYLNKTTFTRNGITVGSYQPLLNALDLQIVLREPITWDIVYIGSIDQYRYERWPFVLTESMNSFSLSVTPTSPGLDPLILLLDANGNELDRGKGILTSTQPAGNYFVQVQPEAGSGFYNLLLQKVSKPSGPYCSIIAPEGIKVGASSMGYVYLGNVPPGGYASAEFAGNYDHALIEIKDVTATDLFGMDPVTAVNGPQNGDFIFAVAGSNGQRATADGEVFAFTITGLQPGVSPLDCVARVSTGDGTLSQITSLNTTLTVSNEENTNDPVPIPGPDSGSVPAPDSSFVTGQVLASKQITIKLYDAASQVVASLPANLDGTFSLAIPAGKYVIVAQASGFLSAQGVVELAAGGTGIKTTISLVPGDIDANGVIDQFDVLTVGMNYNTASPEAADLNGDGIINVLDLETLAKNYRLSGSLKWE